MRRFEFQELFFLKAVAVRLQATVCIGDSTGDLLLVPPGAADELKCEVETTHEAQPKTVQPRTKPAILLMMKLQRPAPYFANALLCVRFSKIELQPICFDIPK